MKCHGCQSEDAEPRPCCAHRPPLCATCYRAHSFTSHRDDANVWRTDETFLLALKDDPITMFGYGEAEVDLVHSIAHRFWQRGYQDLDHELQAGAAAELDDETLDRELQERVGRRATRADDVLEAAGDMQRLAEAGQIDGMVCLLHYGAGRTAFLMKGLDSFNVTHLVTMMQALSTNLSNQWFEKEINGVGSLPTVLESVPREDED